MERTAPVPVERDDAWLAAAWSVGGATALGIYYGIGGTLALLFDARRTDWERLWPALAAITAGGMLAGAALRLGDHADERRGGALVPVLFAQTGLCLVALLLLLGLVQSNGPRAVAAVGALGLVTAAGAANLRTLVLCGGPQWRPTAPQWLDRIRLVVHAALLLTGGSVALSLAMETVW